ncbi:MAG TPA: glycosyltransferase family 9 protein [Steroidobacteraceae bacterium]|nr:glycosyltransferase family 9 protein [Steroidobacteraceae bacterium]
MRRIKMQLRDAELDPIRLKEPPRRICLIRLSAIGDTCNSVPLIRTLQRAWPGVQITWLIGRVEAKLLSLMPEIEFLTLDKRIFVSEFLRLRTQLAAREFDLLLIIHVSFRANLLCTLVRAPIKLGFDRARSRDLQWLFTNRRIQARRREHVLESFWGFADALGITERRLEWNIPLPAEAIDYAKRLIPDAQPTLLISPCSSHSLRNWRAEYYALLADHATRRFGMRVVLCGGPTPIERDMGARIAALAKLPLIDNIGRDTLPQMLALVSEATLLVAPDTGPAHMATAVDTPVIGLYAPTNPARSGPYKSLKWCVNRFPDAARKILGREPEELPWWVKIERPGVMDLIEPDEVMQRLDEFMQRDASLGY